MYSETLTQKDYAMKVSVILAHPVTGSFNHAIAEFAIDKLHENGHKVVFHDLYEEGFDPILTSDEIPEDAQLAPLLTLHCDEIAKSDGIIVVHPNWWGQPPAILKGWIDRVFRPGVSYEFEEGDLGEGVPNGLLRAKTALVFNTSNTQAEREIRVFGDPLETLWKNCIFGLCGVQMFERRTFSVMVTSTVDQRRKWLQEVRGIVSTYFPKV
jgi:putative NADPH-quinone reductase